MSDFLNSVTFGGRNIANVATAFPVPVGSDVSLSSLLSSKMSSTDCDLLKPLTPGVQGVNSIISQAVVLRGVAPSFTHNTQQNRETQTSLQAEGMKLFETCSSAKEMLDLYFRNSSPGSLQTCWSVNQACITKPPFPNIFAPHVTDNGVIVEGYARPPGCSVLQSSLMSSMNTSTATCDMLLSLTKWARKVNIQRYHSFLEGGVELDSFKEALEVLETLSQRYETP